METRTQSGAPSALLDYELMKNSWHVIHWVPPRGLHDSFQPIM